MADEKPIVVPLDGSSAAEHALPVATELAAAFGVGIRFVHAVDPDRAPSRTDFERAQAVFNTYAQNLAARHGLPAGSVRCEVRPGAAARVVLEAASTARFIVISSHGRGGFQATVIGSVADKVVRSAPVPTIMVPALADPPRLHGKPMLIALDGSQEAERALEFGRDLAKKVGATVVLLRAYTIPPMTAVEFSYYPPGVLSSFEDSARAYLREVARPGEETVVAQGSPAAVIVEAAERLDAGLVAMASSGKGLASRLALGSVTERVMHTLRRSLLVLPPAN
jgi:nucleotide-binding universal stress UspA family protein